MEQANPLKTMTADDWSREAECLQAEIREAERKLAEMRVHLSIACSTLADLEEGEKI